MTEEELERKQHDHIVSVQNKLVEDVVNMVGKYFLTKQKMYLHVLGYGNIVSLCDDTCGIFITFDKIELDKEQSSIVTGCRMIAQRDFIDSLTEIDFETYSDAARKIFNKILKE